MLKRCISKRRKLQRTRECSKGSGKERGRRPLPHMLFSAVFTSSLLVSGVHFVELALTIVYCCYWLLNSRSTTERSSPACCKFQTSHTVPIRWRLFRLSACWAWFTAFFRNRVNLSALLLSYRNHFRTKKKQTSGHVININNAIDELLWIFLRSGNGIMDAEMDHGPFIPTQPNPTHKLSNPTQIVITDPTQPKLPQHNVTK